MVCLFGFKSYNPAIRYWFQFYVTSDAVASGSPLFAVALSIKVAKEQQEEQDIAGEEHCHTSGRWALGVLQCQQVLEEDRHELDLECEVKQYASYNEGSVAVFS